MKNEENEDDDDENDEWKNESDTNTPLNKIYWTFAIFFRKFFQTKPTNQSDVRPLAATGSDSLKG